MIHRTLSLLVGHLNDYLRLSFRLKEDIAFLSPVKDTDNSLPTNRVSISIMGIERETAGGISFNRRAIETGSVSKTAPPWHVNINVLMAVAFQDKQYDESIQILSAILSFIQKNTTIPFKDTERFALEMINLSAHDLSNLWGILGVNYLPSILCKVRVLVIDEQEIMDLSTAIGRQDVDSKTI